MGDFRELEVWSNARRLTLAAFELTRVRARRESTSKLTAEIQHSCIEMLSYIQRFGETTNLDSRTAAVKTASKIGLLFAEARTVGLIGTFELALIMREVTAVKESLKEVGSMALC